MVTRTRRLLYPIVIRQVETDDAAAGWEATAIDLPGCVAAGETAEETLSLMEDAQEAWLETARERGMPIPHPSGQERYSGRISLRLPAFVHEQASILARLAGVSLNAYISNLVSHGVGTAQGASAAPPFPMAPGRSPTGKPGAA